MRNVLATLVAVGVVVDGMSAIVCGCATGESPSGDVQSHPSDTVLLTDETSSDTTTTDSTSTTDTTTTTTTTDKCTSGSDYGKNTCWPQNKEEMACDVCCDDCPGGGSKGCGIGTECGKCQQVCANKGK
jgi:hypothetical protein